MIANRQELELAIRQLKSIELALDLLHTDLRGTGPALQSAAPEAYERRIASIQEEIAVYLYSHPADLAILTREPGEPLARAS